MAKDPRDLSSGFPYLQESDPPPGSRKINTNPSYTRKKPKAKPSQSVAPSRPSPSSSGARPSSPAVNSGNDERAGGGGGGSSKVGAPGAPHEHEGSSDLALGKSGWMKDTVTWDGCDKSQPVQSGYGKKCSKTMLNKDFAEKLNKNLLKCVSSAAGVGNFPKPKKVYINHMGTYNNRKKRNSSATSEHAYARAIDIGSFDMEFEDGSKASVGADAKSYRQADGKNKLFYDEFRECWKKNLGCGESGSVGIPGSAMGGNDLHNDHIHLEMTKNCK